ncbi:MAG TPA: 50S ribosomal protein L10 [Anaerolineales bacterium]|nr:50S ribosomal protein L10 [Anaerolineales bacterium]HNO31584.1 50S ribosomal protein L10 [Anaerolineales bacterium]
MAISKQRKEEVLAHYADWVKRSQAIILVEYSGANMKSLDSIRAKIREAGGEFHIVKNTLARRAFADNGMELPEDLLVKSTAVSFAFSDPASTAKALTDATKGNEFVKVKGGFMAGKALTAAQVKALSDMPPLPVMRAQLLGVLQAPAGKLVRTIAEPARGLAAVVKAFSEKGASPAAA